MKMEYKQAQISIHLLGLCMYASDLIDELNYKGEITQDIKRKSNMLEKACSKLINKAYASNKFSKEADNMIVLDKSRVIQLFIEIISETKQEEQKLLSDYLLAFKNKQYRVE